MTDRTPQIRPPKAPPRPAEPPPLPTTIIGEPGDPNAPEVVYEDEDEVPSTVIVGEPPPASPVNRDAPTRRTHRNA